MQHLACQSKDLVNVYRLTEKDKSVSMVTSNKNSQHEFQLSKISNIKVIVKHHLKRYNIHTLWSSYYHVININQYDKNNFAFFLLDIQTIISKCTGKAKFCKNFMKSFLLLLFYLFKTIQCFMQLLILFSCAKLANTIQNCHINFFIKVTLQVGSNNINLMNFKIQICSQSKKHSQCCKFGYRRESSREILTRDL